MKQFHRAISQSSALLSRKIVKNVLRLASGTAFAQAIGLLALPIITRLYTPEELGLYSVLVSGAGLIYALGSLSMPMAITLTDDLSEELSLTLISVIGCLVASMVLLSIALLLFGNNLDLVVIQIGYPGLICIVLLPAVMALSACAVQLLNRDGLFGLNAKATAISGPFGNALKIISGVLGVGPAGLIISQTLANLTLPISILGYYSRWLKSNIKIKISKSIWKYREFAVFRTPQNILNAAANYGTIFIIAGFFSANLTGQYSLALAIIGAPFTLVGGAIHAALYPRITKDVQAGIPPRKFIKRTTVFIFMGSLIALVPVLVSSPLVFGIVFGLEWVQAGYFVQLLCPLFLFALVSQPALAAIPVLGIQKGLLIYEALSSSLRLAIMIFAAALDANIFIIVLVHSLGNAASYIALILWVLHRAGKTEDELVNEFAADEQVSSRSSRN